MLFHAIQQHLTKLSKLELLITSIARFPPLIKSIYEIHTPSISFYMLFLFINS